MDDDLYLPGDGIEEPHYTQFPNLLLDWVMPRVSNAEWKVLSYLCRLTWGFHRYEEPTPITLAQIKRGTGLSHGAVVKALRLFKERRFIEIEPHGSPEHGTEANTYRLRIRKNTSHKNSEAGPLSEHGGASSAHRPPAPSGQPSSLYIKKEMKERASSIQIETKSRPEHTWDDHLCSSCRANRCLPSCPAQERPDRPPAEQCLQED